MNIKNIAYWFVLVLCVLTLLVSLTGCLEEEPTTVAVDLVLETSTSGCGVSDLETTRYHLDLERGRVWEFDATPDLPHACRLVAPEVLACDIYTNQDLRIAAFEFRVPDMSASLKYGASCTYTFRLENPTWLP